MGLPDPGPPVLTRVGTRNAQALHAMKGKVMKAKHWQWRVALAAALVGLVALWPVGPALAGNSWGADYFPNVTLTTQDGAKVRFYDDLLKCKSVAINLF